MTAENRFEDFCGLIGGLSKEIQRIKAAEAARLGLRGSDVMCLYHLSRHDGGLTAAQLSRALDVTRAAVSRTVAHLERTGMVTVGAADGRSRYRALVRLTELGQARCAEIDLVIERVLGQAGAGLSPRERSAMYASLTEILAELRRVARD